ncbi:3-isopropylmalate dehydrogenase [Bacillus carboniphilus]|uniref:3-isopropylmalate dehydrogenase n=2 Tax=Bacillus carboniphilus TaxID=86663 RepID=A0ABY9K0Q0_9BACI|nr:3-isopropylmalate dehydrogenase [Bacillus carboniphilus]WLR44293.1 3-isopropylmalate dehydrogenase [Bacillus carboniphilus]
MKKQIAVLPGDGIGKEVTNAALEVLLTIGAQYNHEFEFHFAAVGGGAIDQYNTPLPEESLNTCMQADAVLFGAVGGPKWDSNPSHLRPETGLLQLRKKLQLYANIRPVHVFPALVNSTPLKEQIIKGVDLVIVRELLGGLYYGKPSGRSFENEQEQVVDTLFYKRTEIERIVEAAFQLAQKRRKKLTSIDKANVLSSSQLWREVAESVSGKYPEVELNHMLVDNAAMQLIINPSQFDVIVTENMFGDILSDESSILGGSLGMLPSASLSKSGVHLYEPAHGSAPDIMGKNIANPVAAILSVAMMLRTSFQLNKEAETIDKAVHEVFEAGYVTRDLAKGNQPVLSTNKFVSEIKERLIRNQAINNIMNAYE